MRLMTRSRGGRDYPLNTESGESPHRAAIGPNPPDPLSQLNGRGRKGRATLPIPAFLIRNLHFPFAGRGKRGEREVGCNRKVVQPPGLR